MPCSPMPVGVVAWWKPLPSSCDGECQELAVVAKRHADRRRGAGRYTSTCHRLIQQFGSPRCRVPYARSTTVLATLAMSSFSTSGRDFRWAMSPTKLSINPTNSSG